MSFFSIFQLLILIMFMLDLESEPRGLSIGSLTIITKSLSLSVKYICVSVLYVENKIVKGKPIAKLYLREGSDYSKRQTI